MESQIRGGEVQEAEEAHTQLHQRFHKQIAGKWGAKWLVKAFELQNFKGFVGKEYIFRFVLRRLEL